MVEAPTIGCKQPKSVQATPNEHGVRMRQRACDFPRIVFDTWRSSGELFMGSKNLYIMYAELSGSLRPLILTGSSELDRHHHTLCFR